MTEDEIDFLAKLMWHAFNDQGEFVGEYGFPRGENGAVTCLDGDFDLAEVAKVLIAALDSHRLSQGLVTVPREPSEAMTTAGENELCGEVSRHVIRNVYERMIAVAVGEGK